MAGLVVVVVVVVVMQLLVVAEVGGCRWGIFSCAMTLAEEVQPANRRCCQTAAATAAAAADGKAFGGGGERGLDGLDGRVG
jgi:hypothetical protein